MHLGTFFPNHILLTLLSVFSILIFLFLLNNNWLGIIPEGLQILLK